MILAGDVGGTKTLLGLFTRTSRGLVAHREDEFASDEHPSLASIVRAFVRPADRIRACAVGVAGPVSDGRSHVVNLRWPVDARRLARALDLPRARVLNDLEATAWGLGELGPSQLVDLTPGVKARPGNAALIAAGTGLGMALLAWDGRAHRPSASEGGHQEFGPRDEREIDLWRFLHARYGRVSIERAVSGPAISAIYEFLVDSGRVRRTKRMRRSLDFADDPNEAITKAALAGVDGGARAAVDLFVSLYGSAAGDLALVANARGGVYVAGGIAPRILPLLLRRGTFVRAFRGKGRLAEIVAEIPVRVVLEPRTALLGAAACALADDAPGNAVRPGRARGEKKNKTRTGPRRRQ
jgi:glucokinase